MPETLLKISRKYPSQIRSLIKKSHTAHTPCIISFLFQPLHNRAARKSKCSFWFLFPKSNCLWKEQKLSICNIFRIKFTWQKACEHGMMRWIGKISRRLTFFPFSKLIENRCAPCFLLLNRHIIAQCIKTDKKNIFLAYHLRHIHRRLLIRPGTCKQSHRHFLLRRSHSLFAHRLPHFCAAFISFQFVDAAQTQT